MNVSSIEATIDKVKGGMFCSVETIVQSVVP